MATSRNATSPVILIAIALTGLIAGYFYYAQIIQGNIPQIQPPAISAQDTLAKFKDINFDFSIFDDTQFRSLKILGESPVSPGSTGRIDIFAPF